MPEDFPYEDIVSLPHPTSRTHPRMPALNRAAQFAPFAALSGYGDAIDEAARLTEDRIEPGEAEREALNEALKRIRDHIGEQPAVVVKYFVPDDRKAGGAYLKAAGRVTKIRPYERDLTLDGRLTIAFDDILTIEFEEAMP